MIRSAVARRITIPGTEAATVAPLALSVIVPTLNERANIRPLLDLLEAALGGIAWEAIVVDDNSKDGTADAVRAIGAARFARARRSARRPAGGFRPRWWKASSPPPRRCSR